MNIKNSRKVKPIVYVVVEGQTLADFVANLIEEVGDKKLSEVDWNKVHIESELDWSNCYYEDDRYPSSKITRIYTNIDQL